MAKCIKVINGVEEWCPFLQHNQKGNHAFHCNWNPSRPCQVCEEDLRNGKIVCPLDLYAPQVTKLRKSK